MRWRSILSVLLLLGIGSLFSFSGSKPAIVDRLGAAETSAKDFSDHVLPFLTKYCNTCHNDTKMSAGLSLEEFKEEAALMKDRKTWEKVKEQITSREMPPKNKPQPTDAERDLVTKYLDSKLAAVNCGLARDPGRPTIRRLNRNEYNNTIRDLVGINFQPADDFPSDDVGYGFDNIGDVLSMPPILMEKYLAAAEKILDSAIVLEKQVKVVKDTFRPQNLISTLGKESKQKNRIALTANGSAIHQYDCLHEGEYILRIRAYGDQAGNELPKMLVQVDRKDVKTIDVAAVGKSQTYEVKAHFRKGKQAIAMTFNNDFFDPDNKDPSKRDRNLYIELLEIEGPFNIKPAEIPESHKKIMIVKPNGINDRPNAARKIIGEFARKAFRRPIKTEEIDRLMKLYAFVESKGESFERTIQIVLRAVLVSPHFLFKIETDKSGEAAQPINDWELATRLSYFLWSSMPDDELFQLAERGQLRNKAILEGQVQRMLKSPKAKALTENFASQWLQLRTINTLAPDKQTYPQFDDELRRAMIKETELYFEYVVKEDRSVLEFLDSNYSFLNGRLAKHYGVPNVSGSEFKKVTMPDDRRGGVLTHASVLTLTSNPTRTSPVKRGKWILENILGTPPPPPDPNAGQLDESKEATLTGSLRQRLEQHRSNPLCASCHQKMDPLGFGLENFDGIGGWRTTDGKFKIDSTGELPAGEKFEGPGPMRKVLLQKADLFRRCFAEKMLTYAIGRGLEYHDKCALDDVVQNLKQNQDRFSVLVLAVIQSDPFQKRKAKRSQ